MHSHSHPHADLPEDENATFIRIQKIAMFLESHFGEVEVHMPSLETADEMGQENDGEPILLVRLDEADARINLISMASPQVQFGNSQP
jgi:cleavage and polyadenylation specificity factor subunit 3